MQKSDLIIIGQILDSMDYSAAELERAISSHNSENAEKLKKAIIDSQKKINFLFKRI